MHFVLPVASMLFGLGAALAAHWLLAGSVPGWLLAVGIGFAAILPGGLLTYLLVQRPLGCFVARISAAAARGELHHCDTGEEQLRHPLLRSLAATVTSMQEALAQLARTVADRGGTLAIASAKLSFSADTLKGKLAEQVQHARSIGATSQHIATTTHDMARNANQAEAAARASRDASCEGQAAVRSTIQRIHGVRDETAHSARSLLALQGRSEEIQDITKIIGQVAGQTNLLALNAAIEAARAGEHGRGFAVVADEVRQLASKTTAATREIGDKLNAIYEEINQAAAKMEQLVAVVEGVVEDTEQVGGTLENIHSLSQQSKAEISQIVAAVQSHVASIGEISGALAEVETALGVTETEVQQVSEGALYLADTAEAEYDLVARFELDTVHDRVRHLAQQTAARIAEVFEAAIASGRVSLDDLMDRDHRPIAGTRPQKFSTRFDRFTDEVLPAIQEPVLKANPFILYAGAVDNEGYFPTHNKRYSQPLTGDFDKDLANNRTKRIFSDRTGSRCGSNTEPFLLQTYKRDTGEIMHDMSAPIRVRGRHWGGFRIGYKSDKA